MVGLLPAENHVDNDPLKVQLHKRNEFHAPRSPRVLRSRRALQRLELDVDLVDEEAVVVHAAGGVVFVLLVVVVVVILGAPIVAPPILWGQEEGRGRLVGGQGGGRGLLRNVAVFVLVAQKGGNWRQPRHRPCRPAWRRRRGTRVYFFIF